MDLSNSESAAKNRVAILLILVLVPLVYLPALNAGFVWDDDFNIVRNTAFRGLSTGHLRWMFTTFHDANYHPLCWLTLGIDFVLWGMDPTGYHLTNIVFHTLNACLFYLLLIELYRRGETRDGYRPRAGLLAGALAGALFFALHPLRTESVVWIATRGDLVCGFFYLLTLICYLRMAGSEPRETGRWWYGLSIVFFSLSLLARAWGITFPVVLLVLDIYPLRRLDRTGPVPASVTSLLKEKVPFLVLSTAGAVLALLAKSRAMVVVEGHGLFDRVMQSFYGLIFYPVKTLFPYRLSPLYLLGDSFNPLAGRYLFSAAAVVGITLLLWHFRSRWPWALTAWVLYAVVVSPLLGLVQSGPQITADRYSYLAGLPFAGLAGAGVRRLWNAGERPGPGRSIAGIGRYAVWVVLLAISVMSVGQIRIWKDTRSLWRHVIELDDTNYIAYNNLGNYYKDVAKDPETARRYLDRAVALNPEFFQGYYNRALLRERVGDVTGAIADYTSVIRIRPDHERAYNNRGTLLREKGDIAGALDDYAAAIRSDPHSPEPYANRAAIRYDRKEMAEALADAERALRVAPPDWPDAPRVRFLVEKIRAGMHSGPGTTAHDPN